MVIKNKKKKVLVFKAYGQPVLRLLPGLNEVEGDSLEPYFKGNEAAQAMAEESLKVIDGTLTAAEKAEAKAAREKNDKLNKSAVLLKRAQDNLFKATKESKIDGKKIDNLEKEVGELKEQLTKALAAINAQRDAEILEGAENGLKKAKEALGTAETTWAAAEAGDAKKAAAKVKEAAAKAVKTAEKAVATAKGE